MTHDLLALDPSPAPREKRSLIAGFKGVTAELNVPRSTCCKSVKATDDACAELASPMRNEIAKPKTNLFIASISQKYAKWSNINNTLKIWQAF
jgi:hypothetical protein